MSYIELGNVLFRGELKGASGRIKGKLTAKAVNAVDTINIADGQITYSVFANYYSRPITAGAVIMTLIVNIPDAQGFVEITAYGHGADYVAVDGGRRIPTNGSHPSMRIFPFNECVALGRGAHSIDLVAGSTSMTSGVGYILARYMRQTGSANQ